MKLNHVVSITFPSFQRNRFIFIEPAYGTETFQFDIFLGPPTAVARQYGLRDWRGLIQA